MLAYYLHNLDPIIVRLGPITPRWYGLAYLLGFLCAYVLLKKLARGGILRLPLEKVPDLVLACCIFGVLVGGRLGHCLFYDPHLFTDVSSAFPYWGVLRVNEGGMSAHGGVIGVILTLFYFAYKHRVSPLNLGDAACMVVPIGLFFGRLANFVNGELYGHPSTVPWAVKFPTELAYPYPHDRALTSEQVNALIDQASALHPELLKVDNPIQRIIGYVQQNDPGITTLVYDALPARHPSQLYEALLEGVVLFMICWVIGRYWRKPGMAASAFLIGYPIFRIFCEHFRVGDAPPPALDFGPSLGVLYSLPMLLLGIVYLAAALRAPRWPEKLGFKSAPEGSVVTEPPASVAEKK